MLSEIGTSRYFIRTGTIENEKSELIIFDDRGNLISPGDLPKDSTNQLLEIFNGLPKAVHRSSGGQILVNPSQLVVIQSAQGKTEIRIKVLFQELERNSQHQVTSKKVILSSKTVPVSEITTGFTYEKPGNQNFVIDMGLGIVPIHVLSSYSDSQGIIWSTFVRHDEIEKAILDSESTQISIYEAPQSILRFIESFSTTGAKDFQWAKDHVQKLIERGEKIIPEVLSIGTPVIAPPGLSFTELDRHLSNCVEQKLLSSKNPYLINNEPSESAFLVPLNENVE